MKTHHFFSLILTTFFLSQAILLNAQSGFEKYQKESIYLQNNKYVKNGVTYPIGLFGGKIKSELEISPNAIIEFEKFEKNRNNAIILYGAGLGALIGGLLIDDNEPLSTGLNVGAIGLLTGTIILGNNAVKNYHKAIWIRNGDILR